MLILGMKTDEVIVLHTSHGPIVLRPCPEHGRFRLGIEAPTAVVVERKPADEHPVGGKK